MTTLQKKVQLRRILNRKIEENGEFIQTCACL